jgi:protein SCO1/2
MESGTMGATMSRMRRDGAPLHGCTVRWTQRSIERGRPGMQQCAFSVLVWLACASLCLHAAGLPAIAHEEEESPARPAELGISATPKLLVIKPAPDFTLLDSSGRVVRLSALRRRVVLMSFIYTQCSAACPLLTQQMALLQARLEHAGTRGGRVHLLSVTVDPMRDSADILGRYMRRFGVDPESWQFLRAEPEQLSPVLAAYGERTTALPDGEIDHPARLYLIDQQGRIREIYSLAFFDERQAFLDIQALLREPRQ